MYPCSGRTAIVASASDLSKLFTALGEQAKAYTELGKAPLYLPLLFNDQFNSLAKAASTLGDVDVPGMKAGARISLTEFLAQVTFAINMLTLHAPVPDIAGAGDLEEDTSDGASRIDSRSAKAKAGKPRIFIGCSVEGLRYAKIIQLQLAHGTRTAIWNQGVYGLSSGTLETLVAERYNYDYAVLVLTPDDTRIKRDVTGPIPRDNVIFELGLFMGALGRENVFMVVVEGTTLPTDLAGITPARFNAAEELNLVSALGPVTTQLEIAMDLI
jgi:predicted nucleotide-binding protein